VLVDKENRACLAGFDLQDTANYSTSYSMSMDQHNHDTWQGAYAAPETFDEKAFNERLPVPKVPADVHSFGVLIYEVLPRVLYFTVTQAQHSGRCLLGNCPFTFSIAK